MPSLRQHSGCVADLKLAWPFNIQGNNFAVFHQHRVAVRAQPQAFASQVQGQTCGFGEFSVAVSDVLRRYVSAEYRVHAVEQTSPEFLAAERRAKGEAKTRVPVCV